MRQQAMIAGRLGTSSAHRRRTSLRHAKVASVILVSAAAPLRLVPTTRNRIRRVKRDMMRLSGCAPVVEP